MASNMIGNLAVNLTMNTAAFQKGATLAEKRAAALQTKMLGVGSSVKGIGAGLASGFAAIGLSSLVSNAFDVASSLQEAASATGVTIEQLQRLRFAAQENGASAEQMDGALAKLNVRLGEAKNGSAQAVTAFTSLGISVEQLNSLNAGDAFGVLVEKISAIKDPTLQAAAAKQVFGKSYAQVLPLIRAGTVALNEAAEASKKNGEISTEDARKLDDLADGWERFKTKLGVATATAIANVAKWTGSFNDFGARVHAWADGIDQAVYGAFVSADKWFKALHDKAYQWLVSGFDKIMKNVAAKIEWVKGKFFGLYDAVVGHSYIPDMVDGIRDHMARLDGVMVKPVNIATDKAAKAFADLQEKVRPLLDKLFPDDRRAIEFERDIETLKSSGLAANDLAEAMRRLRGSFYGNDGNTVETDEILPLTQMSVSLDDLLEASEKTAKGVETANVTIVKSFADTARDVMSSVSGLANSIKSGGIVGILEGVAHLFLTLSSSGAFGSDIQARANAPGRARGGNVTSGRTYVVGERGPELFTPGRGGGVTANKDIGSGGRASKVEIIPSPFFSVVVDGRADSRVALASPSIAGAAARGIQTNLQQSGFRQIP
jgi:hypothetical protein